MAEGVYNVSLADGADGDQRQDPAAVFTGYCERHGKQQGGMAKEKLLGSRPDQEIFVEKSSDFKFRHGNADPWIVSASCYDDRQSRERYDADNHLAEQEFVRHHRSAHRLHALPPNFPACGRSQIGKSQAIVNAGEQDRSDYNQLNAKERFDLEEEEAAIQNADHKKDADYRDQGDSTVGQKRLNQGLL